MQEKGIGSPSIALNRFDDEAWEQLPIKLLGDDDEFMYFTSETPVFSFFAMPGNVSSSA
ncbi:TPA: PGF-pre-PGF domain-containing protein [Methanosarcina acetivorans]|uniref:PGF-pre-PGF domain-containing protein n=1 Tax=Methanosarcina acetivorans TaxID=2214 RepID=A0A832SLG5_9EURY|nr:PGF-pre-PGF domain-containing protein [Methanosarcina acetivorans]HIH95287.1 PGF-pre-PGF domain-containing protein [Methanosarcina acetivorans]